MYNPCLLKWRNEIEQWRQKEVPAPQPVTADEILMACNALKAAGHEDEKIYAKLKIFADYAAKHAKFTGNRNIYLKAE